MTNLPVREGETVVIGIQNAQGSTLMTVADMSVITAEVKVDETDIVNVRLGQPAEVTIDAIPKKIFHGTVSEIGNNAIVRSSGVSTSQQNVASEEAKDFKVVVTLDGPADDLRPGLSATAKITTAHKPNALTIPIQALVQRNPQTEKLLGANGGKMPTGTAQAATSSTKDKGQLVQGVYVLQTDHGKKLRAMFVPITTGVAGATDIEVLNGVKQGDEIVTGRYKILRALKSGTLVKLDNTPETGSDADKS